VRRASFGDFQYSATTTSDQLSIATLVFRQHPHRSSYAIVGYLGDAPSLMCQPLDAVKFRRASRFSHPSKYAFETVRWSILGVKNVDSEPLPGGYYTEPEPTGDYYSRYLVGDGNTRVLTRVERQTAAALYSRLRVRELRALASHPRALATPAADRALVSYARYWQMSTASRRTAQVGVSK
jgi:hypothetical protein